MKATKPTPSIKSGQLTTPALAAQALAKQNLAQYKEAIELYKELLKREHNPVWQQGLADCYLQRALVLAEKGMEKEATVLWENYAGYEKKHRHNAVYFSWLLHTKSHTKIKNYLKNLSITEIDELYPDLAVLLGLWVVSGVEGIYQSLPLDSTFVKHSILALGALTAYQNNQIAAVETALKQIPFRSVYKDYRTLLKAAIALNTDLPQATALLNSIPANSPYQKAAQLLAISQQTGKSLINELIKLIPYQQIAISQVKGWAVKQLKLLQTYHRDKDKLTNNLKFNLAVEYKPIIGREFSERFCQALLATDTRLEKNYEKNFARLNDFDKSRFRALAAEQKTNDYDEIAEYWNNCITILRYNEKENTLKIALILRHLTKFLPVRRKIEALEQSLFYDPEDKASYLALLNYYNQEEEKDKLKVCLEKANKQFPKDIDVLTFAMMQAKKSKAFKKATQYAYAILKIDSVNTQAKDFLFISHLEHARKLFKAKNFALCHKEIEQIEQLSLNNRYQGLTQIMRGFLLFAAENKQAGADLIHAACVQLNDGDFVSYYRINNEALLLAIPLTSLFRYLPTLNKNYLISETEINRFIKVLEFQHQEKNQFIHKAIEKVKAVFKQSLKKQPADEKTILALCECFDKINHFELMRYCLSLTNYQTPLWAFYRLYAKVNGDPNQLSHYEAFTLEGQLEQARIKKDDKAILLINSFLGKRRANNFLFDFEDEYEYDEDEGDLFDELFSDITEDVMYKLEKKIKEFDLNNPAKMMKLLSKYLSAMDLMRYMQDDDAMTAFLFVIAADQLGINIGVTIKDVKALLD
jgi:hypothetical protein